jgi:hypothetical protein
MSALSGGCACAAIRYTCAAEPLFALNCHCRDCQRESGSAFVPVLAVPRVAFAISKGTPRYFELTAERAAWTIRARSGRA